MYFVSKFILYSKNKTKERKVTVFKIQSIFQITIQTTKIIIDTFIVSVWNNWWIWDFNILLN